MKKILILCLLAMASHTAFGADKKKFKTFCAPPGQGAEECTDIEINSMKIVGDGLIELTEYTYDIGGDSRDRHHYRRRVGIDCKNNKSAILSSEVITTPTAYLPVDTGQEETEVNWICSRTKQVQGKWGIDASVAERCPTIEKCTYFIDVYTGTPRLRSSLKSAFRSVQLAQPIWLKNGTNGPMIPVTIDCKFYLLGSVCEPHNCGPHHLIVLYSPSDGSVVADYIIDSSNVTHLGKQSEKQKQVLSDVEMGKPYLAYPASLPVIIP